MFNLSFQKVVAALAVPALAATGLASTSLVQGAQELVPGTCSWAELCKSSFDINWCLPAGPSQAGQGYLEKRLRPLFDGRADQGDFYLEDALAELLRLRADRKAWQAVCSRLERERPQVWKRWGSILSELSCDWDLTGTAWSGEQDSPRDGLVSGFPWDLEKESKGPWRDLGGSRVLYQSAALIEADWLAIKTAESDYRTKVGPKNRAGVRPGETDYEAIYPRAGSYLKSEDPTGKPCTSLSLYFRRDLPFPFGDYECDLRILTRERRDGAMVTDIYSKSRDFYWLAGRDVVCPVRDSKGGFVGNLLIRQYGFDLRGVPDKAGNRQAALRGSLGSLKFRAEAVAAKASTDSERRGETYGQLNGLPEYKVLGKRR